VIDYLHRGSDEKLTPLTDLCLKHNATIVFHRYDASAWTPALSRNIGIRRAPCDIIACIDADGVLHPHAFARCVEWLGKEKAVVRVRTRLIEGPKGQPGQPIFSQLDVESFERNSRDPNAGRDAFGPGSLVMAPTEDVCKVRGWDEKFIGYGIVDWDYVERLEKLGLKVINLTAEEGVWCLHQDHPRAINVEQVGRNDELHEASKQNPDPYRNPDFWGGLTEDNAPGAHYSVLVPVSNPQYAGRLRNCLASVRAQSYGRERIDIVVAYVHDGSALDAASIAALCREFDATLVFYRHQHTAFPLSLARNVAARYCVGRDLVILDADIVLHPKLLETAAPFFGDEVPETVLRVDVMMMLGPPDAAIYADFDQVRFERSAKEGAVAPGTAGCVIVPWSVMEALHGYDERYVGYGFEDWDFTKRLPPAGVAVRNISTLVPSIRVMHQPHPSKHLNPHHDESERIYKESQGTDPKRNPKGWGGLPTREEK
jgi:glycosyltransferase involved in cell wall biosynthesis